MTQFINILVSTFIYRKKLVLIPFYNLGLGGIQTKIISIANELSKNKSVKVLILLQKHESFDRSSELESGVFLLVCPQVLPRLIKNRYHYLLAIITLIFRPNSIFVSLEETSLFITNFVSSLKLPVKVFVNFDTHFRFEQRVQSKKVATILNKATKVIAVSKAGFADLQQRVGIVSPPLTYLPNWVQNVKSTSAINDISVLDKKDILYLGRLEKQKRPWLIIFFAELLRHSGIHTRILIYGDGSLKKKLQNEVVKRGLQDLVVFKNITNTSHKVIRKARYLLVLSAYEGLSFSMLEAMHLKTPILALHAPGVSELVQDNESGMIADNISELFDKYLTAELDVKLYERMQTCAFLIQKNQYGNSVLKRLCDNLIE